MRDFIRGLRDGLLVAVGIFIGVVLVLAIRSINSDDPAAGPPPDACREAATALYGRGVGKLFDQLTQEATKHDDGITVRVEIYSDSEVFPKVWNDFVTACVPPPPAAGGSS